MVPIPAREDVEPVALVHLRQQVPSMQRRLPHLVRSLAHLRLQNVSMTGVDSGGLQETPGNSMDGGKRLGVKHLEEKSRTISRLEKVGGSGSSPVAPAN